MIIIFFWLISQFFAQPITNELRIFEQAHMKELLKFSFCINNIDFVREYTITGHLISLSNLISNKEGNYTIENLYTLYDKHIILIIDDPNFFNPDIQIYVIKHMTYFSLYITDESFFPIVQTMDHVCVLESSNITSLLLYENADYMSEYYHSEFLFDQGFVYYSGLFLFLFSLINFIPKLYYIIWNINDPFQKIFFLSYILNVLLCLLVYVESKLTLEYYDKYKMPPTSSFLYYIINNVDSFLKTYTMIICIAISNGLFFAFTLQSRKLGNYFCIIACLFFFFTLDFPAKGLFNKSHSKLIKDFLEMCLELKELVLFTFLIQICTKQTNIVEMQILRKILFATSLSDSYRKKIKIKMKYLKRQKIALLFFLLLFCILVIFEKSGFSYYMNGVFILLMKMYGNALLLLLLK